MRQIPIERVLSLISYDPETGIFIRLITQGKAIEGFVYGIGGGNILLDGVGFKRSRLAWVIMTKTWPPEGFVIDHINGIKADNRWINLRLATPTQNQYNKAGYGTYPKGVTWRDRKENPFQAKIRVNGKRLHLGSFATEEEAANAYKEASLKYHGDFSCVE